MAHTAKGVSGNIGAVQVQELAALVEKAIKERFSRDEIEALIIPMADTHEELVTGLKEALPQPKAPDDSAKTAPVDREKAVAACKKLAELLSNDDSEAVDFIAQKADVLRGLLEADPLRSLQKAVTNYDFENALELLREQVKECSIELM